MDQLIALDHSIFEWINSSWSSDLLERYGPTWRTKETWIPLYILVIAALVYVWRKNVWVPFLQIAATVGATDYINSSIIKYTFKRTRPCNLVCDSLEVIERINCSSGYSFASSHAANHMAVSLLIVLLIPQLPKAVKLLVILWGISVGVAQIYVGVHFPFDVLMGMTVGASIFLVFKVLFQKIFSKKFPKLVYLA